jgi:type I restriction enzyme, S subunit
MNDKQSQERGLEPRLRFPEFRGLGEWQEKRLEDVAPLQRGFDLPSDQIKAGQVPVVYSNGVQSFHNASMAKAPGIITGRSGTIGEIHFIEEGEYWPHNTSLWVTSFKGNFPKFIYYLFESIRIDRFASGSGVPTLNRNDVHAFRACVPASEIEQQKIADCLSSTDELITAAARKLGALKSHKTGLMQQLFPAEGETVPRLRSPKFREAGEWDIQPLGELAENLDSRRIPVTGNDRVRGQIPYYGASGIIDYINNFIFDEDLLCVSEDGANLVARTSPIAFSISGKCWVNIPTLATRLSFIIWHCWRKSAAPRRTGNCAHTTSTPCAVFWKNHPSFTGMKNFLSASRTRKMTRMKHCTEGLLIF